MKESTESKSLCPLVSMCLCVWHAGISDHLRTNLIRIAFFCLAVPSVAWAQLPIVKLVDKTKGGPSEPVVLSVALARGSLQVLYGRDGQVSITASS